MINKKSLILIVTVLFVIGGLYIGVSSSLYSRLVGYINKNKVIAIVGSEQIYESDIADELLLAPSIQRANREIYLEKIIEDSIVLQAVSDKKLLSLDETYFNSPVKDYKKRLEVVEASKNILLNNVNRVKGRAIVIWFYNNNHIGPMGYDSAKNIARQKIEDIYKRLQTNEITFDEAILEIRNDTTLSLIDPVYKTNVVLEFNESSKEKITFDDNYNKLIWETEKGKYTPVTLLSTDQVQEATLTGVAYSFAFIEQKNTSGIDVSLSEYVNTRKSDIGVRYF